MTRSIAILGAGPAGMSAALWLKQLGLHPIIIEQKSTVGGMLRHNHLNNNWLLGHINQSGLNIAENFQEHILQEKITLIKNTRLASIKMTQHNEGYNIHLNSQHNIDCCAVFIATGTRYKGMEILEHIPGIEKLTSEHSCVGPNCFIELSELSNQNIAIVGAGDNALENACLLLQQGCKVHIIARKQPRAQKQFLSIAKHHPNCFIHPYTTIAEISLIQQNLQLKLKRTIESAEKELTTHQDQSISVDRLHVLAGYTPNSTDIAHKLHAATALILNRDTMGYIQTNNVYQTNIPNIYAIGDIADPVFPSVVSALNAGARAAKHFSMTI